MPLKIATWNVELPIASRRREAIRYHTNREKADVWVLTENARWIHPGACILPFLCTRPRWFPQARTPVGVHLVTVPGRASRDIR